MEINGPPKPHAANTSSKSRLCYQYARSQPHESNIISPLRTVNTHVYVLCLAPIFSINSDCIFDMENGGRMELPSWCYLL